MSIDLMPGFGAFTPAAGGGGVYTLNSADQVNMVLSNSDRTATNNGTRGEIRSTQLRATGKWYFEFSWNVSSASIGYSAGILNSATSLPIGVGYLGSNTNSSAYLKNGYIFFDGSFTNLSGSSEANQVFAFAADLDNERTWARDVTAAGSWYGSASGDPATNSNGFDISASGATNWGAAAIIETGETGAVTFNLGHTAFAGAVPAGFTAWGG
jgi:hypothetical protein